MQSGPADKVPTVITECPQFVYGPDAYIVPAPCNIVVVAAHLALLEYKRWQVSYLLHWQASLGEAALVCHGDPWHYVYVHVDHVDIAHHYARQHDRTIKVVVGCKVLHDRRPAFTRQTMTTLCRSVLVPEAKWRKRRPFFVAVV